MWISKNDNWTKEYYKLILIKMRQIKQKKGQEDEPFKKVPKPKRAQEEMVGFVMIVVLVMVIGLVFLTISLRNNGKANEGTSVILDSFLKSVSYYTTDCEIPATNYRNIEELTADCYNNELCGDGRSSCEVLENTLKGILESSFVVSNKSYITYYKLEINSTTGDLIEPLVEGNENKCSNKLSNEKTIYGNSAREKIKMRFEECYAN